MNQEERDQAREALGRINADLSRAADHLEEVETGAFPSEDAYFEAARKIAEAGAIVVRAEKAEGAVEEGRPGSSRICGVGSKSDHPCWREATTTFNDFACCEEHARVFELGEDEDGWGCALEVIEEWVRGPVSGDHFGHLERLAVNMRDEARRELAAAAAKVRVAKMAAQWGPPEAGEPLLTREQHEELARRLVHADSFVDARTALEDAPDELVGTRDRWVIVDALDVAAERANEEASRYKREIGLGGDLPEEVQPESGEGRRSCA